MIGELINMKTIIKVTSGSLCNFTVVRRETHDNRQDSRFYPNVQYIAIPYKRGYLVQKEDGLFMFTLHKTFITQFQKGTAPERAQVAPWFIPKITHSNIELFIHECLKDLKINNLVWLKGQSYFRVDSRNEVFIQSESGEFEEISREVRSKHFREEALADYKLQTYERKKILQTV